MKNQRKKTLLALFVLFFIVQPLLMGMDPFKVKLRNTNDDNRLVNFEVLIAGNSMPDSSKTPETEQTEPKDSTEQTEGKTDQTEITPNDQTEPEDKEITVSITEKTITINGIPAGREVFEAKFSRIYDGSQSIILEDYYAEYHTYNDIKSYFDKNQIKYREKKI